MRRWGLRQLLRQEDGLQALEWLVGLGLVLDAAAPRLRRTWSLRDAAYAAAAEAFGVPLVTVDSKLLRACHDATISAMSLDDLA